MKTLTKKTEKKKTVAVALTLGGNERKKEKQTKGRIPNKNINF